MMEPEVLALSGDVGDGGPGVAADSEDKVSWDSLILFHT